MDVQQLEEAWAVGAGAREARSCCGFACAGGAVSVEVCAPVTARVAFADDFADAFTRGFDGCDVGCWLGSRRLQCFLLRPRALMLRLMLRGRTWWFVRNTIGGFGLRVPDLRALGRAAREARALLVGMDNTVTKRLWLRSTAFGCRPVA